MKTRIHTSYRAFARALESASAVGSEGVNSIIGVYGPGDYEEYESSAPRFATAAFFPYGESWDLFVKPGLLFVLVRVDFRSIFLLRGGHEQGIPYAPSSRPRGEAFDFAGIVVDSYGRVQHAFDSEQNEMPNDLAYEMIGRDNPTWTLLSDYDTQARQPGDPSVNEVFHVIAGKEQTVVYDRERRKNKYVPPGEGEAVVRRLMAAVKRSIAERRRSPTRLMTLLRRMFQEEYDAAFPGDTEWELGDLGM